MKSSAFLNFLAIRLIEFPSSDRYDSVERRRKNFLRYLTNKREFKNRNCHPVFPALRVDFRCFQHLFNMQMHQDFPRKMETCGTLCIDPKRIKESREKFKKFYSSSEEFWICMTCSRGIFIKMHFVPNMSGEGHQLVFQVLAGTRTLFYTKVDITLEKETSKFQISLRIEGMNQTCRFFYDDKLFFPIPLNLVTYKEENSQILFVSFHHAFHLYKPLLNENPLKRLKT